MTLLRRIPYPRTLAAAAVSFAVYLLLGFFLAPYLIERAIPEQAGARLQRKATVGKVRFNPLLFRLEVNNFALTERDGASIVGFRRLLVNFELSSIARWAWTFSEINLDGLDLRVDIAPDGKLNLAALAAGAPKEDGARQNESLPRILLHHVTLTEGAITFSDRSARTPATATLQPLNLDLRDISTLPDRRGPYTVSAKLRGGGTLAWRGEISLQPVASEGEVQVTGVRPGTAWRFFRDRIFVAEPAGDVGFSARYRFAYSGGKPQLNVEQIRIIASAISLSEAGAKSPILALDTVEVKDGRFDLAARELVLPSVEVHKGVVAVEADARGTLNWQRLVKEAPAAKPEPQPAVPGEPWKVKVEAARITGVALRYRDRSRAAPISVSVGGLDAGFAVEVEAGGAAAQVVVRGLAVKLARVALREAAAEPLATVDALALEGGSFDLAKQQVAIAKVAITGGTVRVERGKDGGLIIVDAFGPAGGGKGARADAPRPALKEGPPWRFTLDAFDLEALRVRLADRGFEPAVAYDLQNVRASVRNVTNDGKAPLKFDAALRIVQGGTVRAAGSVSGGGNRAAVSVKVARVTLKPLQPAVAKHSTLRLESGELSADAKVEYRAGKEGPELRVTGGAGIDNLLLNEAASGERLLSWKQFAANGVAFSLHPDRVRVQEVKLIEPGAKIVIFQDRSLNLAKVLDQPPPQGAAASPAAPVAPTAAAPKPATPGAETAPAFDVGVERISVEKGIVDFSDLSLVLPFAAKVEEFNGAITDVSSDPASAAALKLEGRVGEFGLARVDGTLKPFQPKVHTDIGVVFRNVEMQPLSPYSATFAGRKIASGRVNLDLRYKIENSQLAGDNKLVLDRFTLGETVESPGALKLPFDLAIALLTDSDGKINVAVPVSGNVDDPKFSYGHLIWQAIATVIGNIVTAPFRALAGLFGGSGESPENIAFDAGRSVLQPPEREKLKRVAEALTKRPQLNLVAEGQFGEADRAALRARDVALAVSAKLGRAPAAAALPEPVNALEAKTQRALEALFVERSSEAAFSQFVAEAGKARGKPVQRVNPVLALAGRASADAAFYQAVLKHLNDTARIPEGALAKLADARARAVSGYLLETLAVSAARVVARTAAEAGEERVKLSFDVAPAAQQQASRAALADWTGLTGSTRVTGLNQE